MEIIETIAQFRRSRSKVTGALGLVPTMGYLHEGHLALVRHARARNDCVAVSIFVNPTQFSPTEDLKTYPRDLERDLELLEREGVDLVLAPSEEQMYPVTFDTWIEVGTLTRGLEAESRPRHFLGVATVVAKLFNVVQPHRAYFGDKDAQQIRVIRKMVADLNMDLEIVGVPTVREADGLAISSRNVYLDSEERKAAVVLYRSLSKARDMIGEGETRVQAVKDAVTGLIGSEPLARLDYVSVADSETLDELLTIDRRVLVSLAVWIGETRLIDNVTV